MTVSRLNMDLTVQAARMVGQGMTLEEIAEALRVRDPRDLSKALALFGVNIDPRPGGLRSYLVWLSEPRQRELALAAARRDMNEVDLVTRIVRLALKDDLVRAILDGGGE